MAHWRGKKRAKRLHRRAMAGVAARERKRLEETAAAVEIGAITFSGPMFGGREHTLRCLHRDGEQHLLIEIDGRAYKPRTARGLRSLLARRIWRA